MVQTKSDVPRLSSTLGGSDILELFVHRGILMWYYFAWEKYSKFIHTISNLPRNYKILHCQGRSLCPRDTICLPHVILFGVLFVRGTGVSFLFSWIHRLCFRRTLLTRLHRFWASRAAGVFTWGRFAASTWATGGRWTTTTLKHTYKLNLKWFRLEYL